MAVDPKDRDAFERGQDARESGFISRFVSEQASYLSDSESERAAFVKGLDGEQLDGDKKDDEE